jgi:hypothetical protein
LRQESAVARVLTERAKNKAFSIPFFMVRGLKQGYSQIDPTAINGHVKLLLLFAIPSRVTPPPSPAISRA